jgi:hypothetical protein
MMVHHDGLEEEPEGELLERPMEDWPMALFYD